MKEAILMPVDSPLSNPSEGNATKKLKQPSVKIKSCAIAMLRSKWRSSAPSCALHARGARSCRVSAVAAASAAAVEEGTQERLRHEYEAVVGLETHMQVATASKAFCGCAAEFGAQPNSHVCPICLGHPGTLPALNRRAFRLGISLGLALGCTVTGQCKFDRKHYFYPDLPKGYQISQHDQPLAVDGQLTVDMQPSAGGDRLNFGVERVHLEEDAGKSFHTVKGTLVDYNRAGVPLLEIVSKPDFRSGREAAAFADELRRVVRFAGVGDAEMSEGSMRCDVNISVRRRGESGFGTKVEVKNVNSISALQRAIDFEFERQASLIDDGRRYEVVQETRRWDDTAQETVLLRKKEGLNDYRYFPEPDLPATYVDNSYVDQLREEMPELPLQLRDRFLSLNLPLQDVQALAEEQDIASYFNDCVQHGMDAKEAANWVLSELLSHVNTQKVGIWDLNLQPHHLKEVSDLMHERTISGRIAKESVVPELLANGGSAREIVERDGLAMVTDASELEQMIDQLINENPAQVEKYRNGKKKAKNFFTGQIMANTRGKADPQVVDQLLTDRLEG